MNYSPAAGNGELLFKLDGPIHDVLRRFIDSAFEREGFDRASDLALLPDEYVHLIDSFTE